MKILIFKFFLGFFFLICFSSDSISQTTVIIEDSDVDDGDGGGGGSFVFSYFPMNQKLFKYINIVHSKDKSFEEKEKSIQYILSNVDKDANINVYGVNGTLLETLEIKTFLRRLKFGVYSDSDFSFYKISDKLFKFRMMPPLDYYNNTNVDKKTVVKKQLEVAVTPFKLYDESELPGPANKRIINQFRLEADKAVKFELGSSRYSRKNIKYSDPVNLENAFLALSDKYENIKIAEGNNSIISGMVFYNENKKSQIVMKLYILKGKDKSTQQPVFFESNVVRRKKSTNFLEKDEKVDRMVRRMTRKLLGQRIISKNQSYMVTGAGLVMTGMGVALFANSSKRHNVYKDNPDIFAPAFDRFQDEPNPREAYFNALKRTERLSYLAGLMGIATTTFGIYEIAVHQKDTKRIFDELADIPMSSITPPPPTSIVIGTDVFVNPTTSQTIPKLKLTYNF